MLITYLKRTPMIKSSNMSIWKIKRLHHMTCYYNLQKGKTKIFNLVAVDECFVWVWTWKCISLSITWVHFLRSQSILLVYIWNIASLLNCSINHDLHVSSPCTILFLTCRLFGPWHSTNFDISTYILCLIIWAYMPCDRLHATCVCWQVELVCFIKVYLCNE